MLARRALAGFGLASVVVVGGAGAASAVDCTVTPSDPACVSPSPSSSPAPATPTATVTATETATVTASPAAAPGEDSGVYIDPSTGSLKLDQANFVAVGVVLWLGALVAGLLTGWVVLP